jgi:predicted nucleic acid-binding protein
MPESPTVSNSSCLIALDAAGSLAILERLYNTIAVPDAVVQECGGALPPWVQVHSVQNQALAQSLRLNLGAGEAEATALSVERLAARLILDDKKARRVARQLNLPVTGTLAVLPPTRGTASLRPTCAWPPPRRSRRSSSSSWPASRPTTSSSAGCPSQCSQSAGTRTSTTASG